MKKSLWDVPLLENIHFRIGSSRTMWPLRWLISYKSSPEYVSSLHTEPFGICNLTSLTQSCICKLECNKHKLWIHTYAPNVHRTCKISHCAVISVDAAQCVCVCTSNISTVLPVNNRTHVIWIGSSKKAWNFNRARKKKKQ